MSSVAVSVKGKYYRRKGIRGLSQPAYVKDIEQPLERYDEKMTPLSRSNGSKARRLATTASGASPSVSITQR